jgi:hypothetical protein
MKPYQIKMYLHIKRNNYQNQKTTHRMGRNPNQLFNRYRINMQNIQKAHKTKEQNKYMKKCSTSLVIKEMQIKITLRFYFTLIRTAITKKTNNSKCWWECGGNETANHCRFSINWHSPYGNQYGNSSKRKKNAENRATV